RASLHFIVLQIRPLPRSTLFPYTTLFRSRNECGDRREGSEASRSLRFIILPTSTPFIALSVSWPVLRKAVRNRGASFVAINGVEDRKSTRLNSSHVEISYAVFCLKKKNDH